MANGWDSLDRLYGMCLNMFGAKRTRGFYYGTPSAECPVFVQFNGDYVFEKVLEVVGSCFRLGLMFGKCSQCLLKLLLTGMCVVYWFASFLLS